VREATTLYRLRGTREGLWRLLLLYLGMEPDRNRCPHDGLCDRCAPPPANCAPPEEHPGHWQPPPLLLEHYQLRRWLFLGSGRLGDAAVLWGRRIVNRSQLDVNAQAGRTQLISTQDPYRDPFHVYAHRFSVFVPASVGRSDAARKGLENLLNAESPAHTIHTIEYVEPRFRVGIQSMIGLDSVIGRYPEGVTLNATQLGSNSVLSGAGRPALTAGEAARIGTSTILD
jgi:hypothetical protein